jgi:toxin ParE1/3/4
MESKFHPGALEDYQEAAKWYAQRDPELAFRFVDAVEQAIMKAAQTPDQWRLVEQNVHRCFTHVFPYGILYTVEFDHILIVAVMHCSREPGYWRRRLQND